MVENESKIEAQDLLIDYRSYYCHLLVIDRIRQLGAKFRSRFNVFFLTRIALRRSRSFRKF